MNEHDFIAPSNSHFKCPVTLSKNLALPELPISFALNAIASLRRAGAAKLRGSGVLLRRHNAVSGIAAG